MSLGGVLELRLRVSCLCVSDLSVIVSLGCVSALRFRIIVGGMSS